MSFDELRERVLRRVIDYDPAHGDDIVLSEAALADAAELWQAAQPADPEHPTPEDNRRLTAACQALGALHYERHTALPPGPDQPELARAIVFLAHPGALLPEPLRAVLGPTADPDRQADLALSMLAHAETSVDEYFLDAAISLLTAAVAATPADHPDRALYLTRLGTAYMRRFERGGVLADLERAIDSGEQAVAAGYADRSNLAMYVSNLGSAYMRRFERGGVLADLERAIDDFEQAVSATPPGHYYRGMYLSNLGTAYRWRFERGGVLADLDKAIEVGEQAVAATAADHPGRAMYLSNLGTAYMRRFERGGVLADLEHAIDNCQRAVAATPPGHPDLPKWLSNLGNAYIRRFERGGVLADLEHAIDNYQQAVAATPADHPDRAGQLSNLGNAYLSRIDIGGRAIDPERPYMLAGQLSGDRAANLAKAITCYTEALRFRTAEADPGGYAMTQYNLGNDYAQLPGGDRAANLAKAITCFTEALRFHTAEATPADCRTAAGSLGDVQFQQGRWAEAHAAYSAAIRSTELLYQATGSEVGRRAELAEARGAVAADAYCLAQLGQLTEAVERLEAGRARALGEALARDRAALREVEEADRAAFATAADRINALEAAGRRRQDTEAPAPPEWRSFAEWSAEIVQARQDLARVIQRIRAYVPGFAGEGLDYPAIAAAASPARPLVYLLTTPQGGLALLVPAGSQALGPEHAVWLDGLIAARLDALLVKRHPSGEVCGGYLVGQVMGDPGQLAAAVTECIEFLRREVFGPLAGHLADLGLDAATVVPIGRLSLLPLPAAAPEGCTIALAPSARALGVARHALRERAGEVPVLLAVGNPLPLPNGWSALHYAKVEVRAIERFFAPQSRRVLAEEQATAKAVMQGLAGATYLHLSCHGKFDSAEPLDSALYLSGDDRLTLRDLLDGNLELSSQRLAVLSACQTGITEFRQVPDEVIGLPAGFLQAGVPGVVATLWPVNDRSTAVLMTEFYRLLLARPQDPAAALTGAQRYLRDATARDLAEWFERRYDDSGGTDRAAHEAAADLRSRPDLADRPYADPVYWAGFVYFGP